MLINPSTMREMRKRSRAQGVSICHRLVLYWICMVLAVLAAALLLLSVTGVTSRTSRQFSETLENQQKNAAALLTGQIDTLTAKSTSFSQQVSTELDNFLAERGIAFDRLNDDPALIAELESVLLPALKATLDGTACSGAYLCLDATANTALPAAAHSRMGLYLRYSSLRSANPSGNVVYFRGAVSVARENNIQLHNRWNLELNTDLIPGYEQVMAWSGDRLSDGCLWTGRLPLTDTWEEMTLLCVPIQDEAGTVRGICGVELSDLYFTLSHDSVSSPYGSFLTLLSPLDGDTLLLERAMLGDTDSSRLSADGEMRVNSGKYYDTFTCGDDTYLGRYQIIPGKLADENSLAVVTLVPESSFRTYERTARMGWIIGTLVFLAAMLTSAVIMSRRFAKPITESLAAMKAGTDAPSLPRSGISEFDELLEFLNSRPQAEISQESLPPEIRELVETFAQRAATLTGTERTVLGYYISGYTTRDIPDLMFISASTAKAHNRNIYRKLGVDSYDGLKAYIDIFQRCGQSEVLLAPKRD